MKLILALAIALTFSDSAAQRGNNGQIRGGMMGGNNKGGMMGGMMGGMFGGGMFGGRFDDADFIPVQCDDSVTLEPCGLVGNETGVMVCRMGRNDSTRSVCVDADEGVAGDTCGCCGEACPAPCTVACDGVEGSTLQQCYVSFSRNSRSNKC